jgi:hypothetical protein
VLTEIKNRGTRDWLYGDASDGNKAQRPFADPKIERQQRLSLPVTARSRGTSKRVGHNF